MLNLIFELNFSQLIRAWKSWGYNELQDKKAVTLENERNGSCYSVSFKIKNLHATPSIGRLKFRDLKPFERILKL